MSYNKFKKLHQQDELLILGNIWDAQSAKIAQDAGFQALGSSSHAIANSMGYEDGQKIKVDEILFVVERIIKAVKIPLSVDFEAGYSDKPEEVAANVKRLADAGVVGINLEDAKPGATRKLIDPKLHVQKIQAIKASTKNIFINARTDTYVTKHENALQETINRAKMYEQAGADGLFVPVIETKSDITSLLKETKLPLNIFLTPNIPNMKDLNKMGVKRLSHGAKIYDWIVSNYTKEFDKFLKNPKLPK